MMKINLVKYEIKNMINNYILTTFYIFINRIWYNNKEKLL
jgi:hypothetical protein